MNIWLAAYIQPESYGGVLRSMIEIAQNLQIHGHKVTIHTVKSLPSSNYLLFALRLAIRYFCSFYDRPSSIIARSTDSIFCSLLIKIMQHNTRTIIHNHGWEPYVFQSIEQKISQRLITHPTSWKSHIIRFPLLQIAAYLSTYCVSGTLSETRYLKKKYPQMRHKFFYIPNGVPVKTKCYWSRHKYTPPRFLFVGSATWKKNLAYAIHLFALVQKSIPESTLFCIGATRDNAQWYAGNNALMESITFIPHVHFNQMEHWYKQCPYLLSCSRYEGGHSLALLEAMSFGIIVFASELCSNKEVVIQGHNGFLISGIHMNADSNQIIGIITQDPIHTRIVRKHAFKTANRNNWTRQTKRWEKLLCAEHYHWSQS